MNFYSSYVMEHEDSVFDVIRLIKGYGKVQQYTFKRNKSLYYNDDIRDYVLHYSKNLDYINAINQLQSDGIQPEYKV